MQGSQRGRSRGGHRGGRGGQKAARFELLPNTHGIMVTCQRNLESRCASEMAQLLDRVLEEDMDKHFAVDVSDAKDESFEAQIAREVKQIRSAANKLYRIMGSGELQCIVFFELVNFIDPLQVVERLFVDSPPLTTSSDNDDDDLSTSAKPFAARFCHRIIPMARIFPASIANLRQEALDLFPNFFSNDTKKTYGIVFESRLSSLLERSTVITVLGELISAQHKVQLDDPELTVIVQVFKGMCSLSVLPKYKPRRKYNIQEYHQQIIGVGESAAQDAETSRQEDL